MKIAFHKPYITNEEISEVVDSLKSGWLTMGPKTLKFENAFRKYIGAKHAISVSSCTAALHLALKTIGVTKRDEVIIPTMTFTATGETVCYLGAKPAIVDVDRNTHNIDFSKIEKTINSRTKAIIPVHYAGQPCDMSEIMKIAKKRNIYVIEDAAHALPASYNGKKIGTIGDITCFSFYATKTLSTGEGGMATTQNDEWTKKMKVSRFHGISKNVWNRYSQDGSWYYEVVDAGFKYNMTDIQAALGLAQLKKLEWMWQRRKEIAKKYTEAFQGSEFIITPSVNSNRESAWHLYVIKLNLEALKINRARFIEELKAKGIATSVHFIPLHRHPFYKNSFGYNQKDFPHAEWLYERIISLPIYPGMTNDDVAYISKGIKKICKKFKR